MSLNLNKIKNVKRFRCWVQAIKWLKWSVRQLEKYELDSIPKIIKLKSSIVKHSGWCWKSEQYVQYWEISSLKPSLTELSLTSTYELEQYYDVIVDCKY